ncbi:unnamed protein product [Caenorhabditis auriculariae]|uniref:Uncharacterized protein n=1 Tax=Caenorhabditis auriculariae TaxID=2777116 RepID=A0A8S1HSW2_9PELO|nr:unnamed protein product [Caenorhabditis auriculariae]
MDEIFADIGYIGVFVYQLPWAHLVLRGLAQLGSGTPEDFTKKAFYVVNKTFFVSNGSDGSNDSDVCDVSNGSNAFTGKSGLNVSNATEGRFKRLRRLQQLQVILVGMVIASPRSTFETVRLFFRRPNLAKGRKTNAKEDMVKEVAREEEPDSDKVSRSRELLGSIELSMSPRYVFSSGKGPDSDAFISTAIAKALRDENMPRIHGF